jgi:hypothetical protein
MALPESQPKLPHYIEFFDWERDRESLCERIESRGITITIDRDAPNSGHFDEMAVRILRYICRDYGVDNGRASF